MVSPLKLINKTKWSTQDLRKLCKAVIKHKGSHKNHLIIVQRGRYRYSKSTWIGGLAWVYGSKIIMKVPDVTKPNFAGVGDDGKNRYETIANTLDIHQFGQVLEHEIDHNLGLRHNVMGGLSKLDVSYLDGFVVGIEQPKVKPKEDLMKSRQNHVLQKIKTLESEIKRKQNLLKKWNLKNRYYLKKEQNQVL